MSEREALKRRAAERAVELVQDGMKLGLGTGSTARHVLQVLAERQSRGELRNIVGVATSAATAQQARDLGITMRALDDVGSLDLGIDGADEVDGDLNLIKGMGGALLWEKIVAAACARFVVVVDDSKLVSRLGTKGPLPVEVVPFGWTTHIQAFQQLGARTLLRRASDGSAFRTDGGHHIIDCAFPQGITDAYGLQAQFKNRPGVVETGLFLELASAVVVAYTNGVHVLENREEGKRGREDVTGKRDIE
ncbi:MAG: ribose-5-phosphate isomerase RpiA [Longimicrobiales bacterium]